MRAVAPGKIVTLDEFEARFVSVAYEPSRATFELSQAAYVTLISVTDAAIEAIIPTLGAPQHLVQRGAHVVYLNRLDSARYGIVDQFASVGALSEYNRCLANARLLDARRREARRRIVGRDSAGRPIYGEAEPQTGPDAESRCRAPVPPKAPVADRRPAPLKVRYLLLFASDTKVAYRDIVDLAIAEGDPQSMIEVIGWRLFTIRGARWSGSFVPW